MTPQQLFEDNQAFATFIANKYRGYENFEDLMQVALIGLHEASLKFDASRGIKFTTYAGYLIRGEILRHIERWQAVYVPRHIVEYSWIIKKLDYANMSVEQIVKETDITQKYVEQTLQYLNIAIAPIDGPAYNRDDSMSLAEMIPQSEDNLDDSILFKDFVKSLNDRENTIVLMRLDGKSQQEIAGVLGISQVQVSRLLAVIKNKFINFTK